MRKAGQDGMLAGQVERADKVRGRQALEIMPRRVRVSREGGGAEVVAAEEAMAQGGAPVCLLSQLL